MSNKNKAKNKKPQNTPSKSFKFEGNWYALIVMIFAFILYANTLNHGFVLDDDLVSAKNSFVMEGKVGKIFTSSYHEAFTGKPDRNYRPMSMAAFAIEKNFVAKNQDGSLSPGVFHFFNLIWYSIGCGLLFIFLKKIFKDEHWWLAMGISLLFAAHPIHTEVVASIKSRDEIFVFVGMMATLYSLLKYDEKEDKKWLVLSLFSYLFACLTKESGLPIIGLVPLTLYFFSKNEDPSSIIKTSAFYLIPVVVFFMMRQVAIGDNGDTLGVIDNILYTEGISAGERFATAIGMISEYLQLLIFPHPLSYDYSAYQIPIMNWGNPKVIIGIISTLGLLGISIKFLPSKHPISWSIFLFGIMFILVSNIPFIIGVTMAERLMFSPSLAFCLILGFLLFKYLYKGNNEIIYWAALGIILAAYSYKTYDRNQVWESNETLHLSGMDTAPNSARALTFYGKRLYDKASATTDNNIKKELGEEALTYYDRATGLVPSFRDAYHNKALCHLDLLNNPDAAIQEFDAALGLDSDYYLSICGKGLAYHKKGDNDTSLQFLRQAYDLAPNNVTVKQNLIIILLKVRDLYRTNGDIETAISYDKQVKVLRGEALN
jgi:tetratricopeptide (TPR) repeat protein